VEKQTWIKDYVDSESTVVTKGVQDAETAMKQELEDLRNAEKARMTNQKPIKPFEQMLNTIGDSVSNLACSDNEQDPKQKQGDQEDPEQWKLHEYDEPGWLMDTISRSVHQYMESNWPLQIKLDKLTQ